MSRIIINDPGNMLTIKERAEIAKWERAKEVSGWRAYPSTCSAIFARIPPEWIDKYTAQQLGEIAALLKSAYDDGVQYGRNHAE